MNGRDVPAQERSREHQAQEPRRCLEYDPVESRLFRAESGTRDEIALPPQLHRLVQYAAERNRAAGDRPVLCTHDELIGVLWGAGNGTPQALAIVVHELRERLGPAHASLVENVRGRGYRLAVCAGDGAPTRLDQPTRSSAPARWLVSPLLRLGAAVALGIALAVGVSVLQASSRVPPPFPILRMDSQGDGVQRLQLALADVGFDSGSADGWFGPMTARALREFQLSHGLVVDGEYGPNSRAALVRELARRRAAPLVLGVLALGAAAAVHRGFARRRQPSG
ncbi:MAG TPA: peptidoglycan-binding protein [Chloroflexota bacterium]|nr:peptidoglycan-binding protein [Chloroflexota bacterium]